MFPGLKSIENVHDLGGIVCHGGRKIAPRTLFRGAHLGDASAKDLKNLTVRLGVTRIVDFRRNSERSKKPAPALPGVQFFHFSALPDNNGENADASKFFSNIMNVPGNVDEFFKNTYAFLVTDPFALTAYRNFFNVLLAGAPGAVYWHCSQGKDRTGIAAMALLFALGASREDILKEYMLTNELIKKKLKKIERLVRVNTHNETKVQAALALTGVKQEYLESAFDAIDKTYGSSLGFLREALNLTDAEIERLCELYLV